MSNNKHVGVIGKGKTTLTGFFKGNRSSGNGLALAFEGITQDPGVDPPVSAQEAESFCRINIKRCNVNLANAKDRGDKRAVINLERKLAIYRFLYEVVRSVQQPNAKGVL